MSIGRDYSLEGVRRQVKEVLATVDGIDISPDVLDLENLPDSVKDRSFSVIVSATSDRSLRWTGCSQMNYTVVINYAKRVGTKGKQEDHLTEAYTDLDNMFHSLMQDQWLSVIELTLESQEPPIYNGEDKTRYMLFSTEFSAIATRSHS